MARLQDLLDKRAKVWAEAQDIRERAERDGRDLTTEEDTTLNRALDEYESITRQVGDEERAQRIESGQVGSTEAPEAPANREQADSEADYRTAFGTYLRGGMEALEPEQRQLLQANYIGDESRAQATSPGSGGGFLIPTETLVRMTETMKAFGGLLGVVDVIDTSTGNPLNWPSNDATAQKGRILAENAAVTGTDLTFGQLTLGSYTYSSDLILASWQVLQDSIFDLESFVARKAGERLGRIVADHLVTGSGTGEPSGLFTTAATGATGATGQTTSVTQDDLIDLQHSVDPAYRLNARWVMADAAAAMVRKITTTQGWSIWQPALTAGEPDLLLGKPVTIDQSVAVPAASAKSIGFGDTHAAYVVRRVSGGQLVRLNERYADNLQTGFFAFMRLDGKQVDSAAFKVYAHSAT